MLAECSDGYSLTLALASPFTNMSQGVVVVQLPGGADGRMLLDDAGSRLVVAAVAGAQRQRRPGAGYGAGFPHINIVPAKAGAIIDTQLSHAVEQGGCAV